MSTNKKYKSDNLFLIITKVSVLCETNDEFGSVQFYYPRDKNSQIPIPLLKLKKKPAARTFIQDGKSSHVIQTSRQGTRDFLLWIYL